MNTLEERVTALEERAPEDHIAIICSSGDLDRLLAALTLAIGGCTMGNRVSVFFTFWGLQAIAKPGVRKRYRDNRIQKLFALLFPGSPKKLRMSRFHFFGLGAFLFRRLMKQQNCQTITEMIDEVREMGGQAYICTQTMEILGIRKEEMPDFGPDGLCGITTFFDRTRRCRHIYFL